MSWIKAVPYLTGEQVALFTSTSQLHGVFEGYHPSLYISSLYVMVLHSLQHSSKVHSLKRNNNFHHVRTGISLQDRSKRLFIFPNDLKFAKC